MGLSNPEVLKLLKIWFYNQKKTQKETSIRNWRTKGWMKVSETLRSLVPSTVKTMLEIGGGIGLETRLLEKKVETLFSLEVATHLAKENKKKGNQVIVGMGEILPFKNESFDGVYINNILEHSLFPKVFLEEIYRVIREGGYFMLAIPPDRRVKKG